MTDKLEAFRALLEAAQLQALIAGGYTPEHHPHACKIKVGRKYANVDVCCRTFSDGTESGAGRYMVELATGAIYGIKGYGVINRGHCYGTLDTIHDWNWSGYTAVKRIKEAA